MSNDKVGKKVWVAMGAYENDEMFKFYENISKVDVVGVYSSEEEAWEGLRKDGSVLREDWLVIESTLY